MTSFFTSVGIGIFGAALLYLVFRLLKSSWPTSYSDMKNVVDSALRRNAWVYVMLRFGPMYVVSVLVASLCGAAGGQVLVGLGTCASLHLAMTNFHPRIMRRIRSRSRNQLRYLVAFLSSIVFVLGATVVAFFTWHFWLPVLPDPDELVQSVWTSLFVGVVVIFIRSVGVFSDDAESRVTRAKQDLGDDLWQVIELEARQNDVSPDFIRAVVLTECIQRPGWIRKMERTKGIVFRSGTYGVAQVFAERPISDEESIRRLCRNHAGYYPAPNADQRLNRTLLGARFEMHNPDPVFVEQALEFFDVSAGEIYKNSDVWASDGKTLIEVVTVRRNGSNWVIGVSLGPAEGGLEMNAITRDGIEDKSLVTFGGTTDVRRHAVITKPIEVSWIEFRVSAVGDSAEEADKLILDLDDPYFF